MTRLCLTLNKPTLEENLKALTQNSPDMAELRIDLLNESEREGIVSFANRASLPLILTCRKDVDGGRWCGSDSEREELLLKAMDGDFGFVDIEEDEESVALVVKAREKGIRIIRSFHDFDETPADLEERLEAMSRKGDLVKAAVMTRGSSDLLRLFQVADAWKEGHPGEDNLILLGMGPYGVPSRILAGRMGCFLSFCSPDAAETAPGHMSWDILHHLYRADRVGRDTRIFGIIGNPVLHTRSPQIHNPGFHSLHMNAVYLPFTVDDLPSFFSLAELLNLQGCSVTVPHKQAVREFLVEEDEAVSVVGACNTLLRRSDAEGGGFRGANTDVIGFIDPLKDTLKEALNDTVKPVGSLMGMRAAVIGAGGAGRSAVYALVNEGCRVSIFNRSRERAVELAAEFGAEGGSLEELSARCSEGNVNYDLIIQTTSVGMHGVHGDPDPIPFYNFRGTELVYDIIYTPAETVMMKRASEAGCRVLGGMPMLKAQGRAQFRMFTGKDLPD